MSDIEMEHTKSKLTVSGDYLMGKSIGGCQLKDDEFMVAQVRGWGHLQYLGEEKAMAIQDANAARLALCWNSYDQNQQTIKDLVGLLEMAKCPNCDGSGSIAHQCSEDKWEQEQCQWCFLKYLTLAVAEKGIEK
jgi:hypothetical protein